ncbi:hypothetical protein MOV76_39380, partial [Rhizobium sp. PRIMUS64]|nr:hypothetical protein [Rhizobium sp. PRIMUS64]
TQIYHIAFLLSFHPSLSKRQAARAASHGNLQNPCHVGRSSRRKDLFGWVSESYSEPPQETAKQT